MSKDRKRAVSDFSKLPRDIADCMRRAGEPISENQLMLLAGYLAPVQGNNEQLQAQLSAARPPIDTTQITSMGRTGHVIIIDCRRDDDPQAGEEYAASLAEQLADYMRRDYGG